MLAPALVLTPTVFARPARAQALLLASRAAARALDPWPIPVLAVGEATAEEARRRGFAEVRAAGGDATALARLSAATLDPAAGPLLLAVGENYGAELAAMLRAAGFRVARRVAYRAMPAPSLAEPARQALQKGRLRAALFFSPRSAACSMALLREAALDSSLDTALREVEAVAISPRVAAVLSGLPWRSIRAAPRPDQDSLLETLGTP